MTLVSADAAHSIGKRVWSVASFYTPDECREAIALAEARGFDEAPITTGRGMVMRKDVRNNDRVMFDDPARASNLFERIRPHVPSALAESGAPAGHTDWTLSGVNERLRIYRYGPGQRFKPHYDGCFMRERDVEESALTFMVYLNDDFEGGATTFLEDGIRIRPRTGDALLFFHAILHEGTEVTRGTKYVLRTDVMYRST